jgi:hypothetical protein
LDLPALKKLRLACKRNADIGGKYIFTEICSTVQEASFRWILKIVTHLALANSLRSFQVNTVTKYRALQNQLPLFAVAR